MKKNTWIAVTVWFMVMLTGCGAGAVSQGEKSEPYVGEVNETETQTGSDSVTVTATSSVYAVPDIVTVNFGVQTQSATAEAAQEANARVTEQVIERLKTRGIEAGSIKTSGFDMYPHYNNSGQISGYNVHTTLTVLDVGIEEAGAVISDAIDAGANQVNGLSYACSRYDDFYNEALAAALAIAKAKGETLAGAAARGLSGERSIVEGYQDVTYRYNTREYGLNDMMSAKEESTDAGMTIEPGEAEIKAVVTVTYGLD